MSIIFRIDDISVNTSEARLRAQIEILLQTYPDSSVLLGVSPLVFNMDDAKGVAAERIFPKILNAYSDHRLYYKTEKLGIPDYVMQLCENQRIMKASHGLLHVDHRLMDRGAQELSILTSCALVGSNIFIPPFNKWNTDTEAICSEADIELIKFEDGWRHLGYNKIDSSFTNKYYYHTHDFDDSKFLEAIK
jgi:hypothetical protein